MGACAPLISVMAMRPTAVELAARLAEDLGLMMCDEPLAGTSRFVIEVDDRGLALRDCQRPGLRALRVRDLPRHRAVTGRGLLGRALGKRSHSVMDATAGFGSDAIHCAELGLEVIAIERSPVVCALLKDRIQGLPLDETRLRLSVKSGDSRQWLVELPPPDVVYIDPMFPGKENASAKPSKAQQLLRALVGKDSDAVEVLQLACRRARHRVVVKRPRHAPPLTGEVHHQVLGRAVRYDVYLAGQ
ncbi:MAG TPA: 16S rRNA methyltransferase [Gammaproteobacteria bacterium]|nr:16S rRNA methyltransferase [Gammaproteobacteria bacterium]|tara:strand:- start:1502 stop:2236 length:735 start_codon:yes stop_codon:yes gene_type:complete